MAIREISFPSFNGRDTVMGWVYTPITEPRAIVQVVHGYGEHSRRYLHMILRLNDAGFIVCADDHVGHGKTAAESGIWMDYGDKGYMTTTEDEHSLRSLVTREFPGLPYFLFGHSWGSMIARNYAVHYGAGMAGLMLCGTCGVMEPVVGLERDLELLLEQGKGKEVDGSYVSRLFAGTVDRFENPNTPNDWIANDPDVVADHAADPFNNLGNIPNNQSTYDFAQLIGVITGPQWAAKVPTGLPVYNIAGDQDPIGNYGEGVYAVSNWLCNTGHKNVQTKLYSGYRHEIHNERAIRDQVVDGMIAFVEGLI